MIGKTLAHYEITDLLGKGGMGEVYRARDTKLGRDVALKILPREMSGDPERLARFQREARTLASLQHNNIASVYGFEDVDGVRFLVMELVEGEDLSERLLRGPLPVGEAMEIAMQIATGLEVAHEKNIVHRDLKPANIKLGADGQVKILDFGLARAYADNVEDEDDPMMSPTITAAMTQAGTILGTAAYMSPEQARGKAVDKRADIWAFGIVLYEMLSGQRAFEGETISDTLAAVLRANPDRGGLPNDLPRPVERLLDRCLEKNPRRRLRDIGEAVILLEDLQSGELEAGLEPGVALPSARKGGRERLLWGVALLVALILGAAGAWTLRPSGPEPLLRKLTLNVRSTNVSDPVVSPDGRHIAFLDGEELWVRSFDQLEPKRLADQASPEFRPVWSPESTNIAFVRGPDLVRIPLVGGAVTPLCRIGAPNGGAGGSWAPDGRILFTTGSDHVYVVSAGGGVAEVHTAVLDSVDIDIHHPHLLPDGQSLLVVRHKRENGPSTISVIQDGVFIDLYSVPAGVYWDPIYDPRGYVIVSRSDEGAGVWAAAFSLNPPRLTGDPYMVVPRAGSPSVAQDGSLVYQLGALSFSSVIVTVNRAGEVLQEWTDAEFGNYSFALSPDESDVAMEIRGSASSGIWIHDLNRSSRTRFAFGPGGQSSPSWTADGEQIIYASSGELWQRPADGSSEARYLGVGRFPTVTPDGNHIFYTAPSPTSDIWVRSLTDPADSTLVLGTPAEEWDPCLSPVGKYFLYSSDESGDREVYMRSFPTGTGRWQVSIDGGEFPQWSSTGDKIYYMRSTDFMEVELELEPQIRLGTPQLLFSLPAKGLQGWGPFAIRPLQQPDRFMALKLAERGQDVDIVVVDNWTREFETSR